MRRFWLLLMLSILATGLHERAAAQQPKGGPAQGEAEPLAPEKLGKLALTLDPEGHMNLIRKVFFTPDSKQVITLGNDRAIHVWDVETGRRVKVIYPPGIGSLTVAALAHDGKRLVLASAYAGAKVTRVIHVLAMPEGKIERVFRVPADEAIQSVAISASGKRVASSAGSTVRIWDLDRDEPAQVLRKLPARGLAFSPDGSRLACVGGPKAKGSIIDVATGKAVADITGNLVVWSRDGKTLATWAIETGLQFWDADGQLRREHLPRRVVKWLAFSNDANKVLVTWMGPSNIRAALIDVATGEESKSFLLKGISTFRANTGDFSPDGRLAATEGALKIFIWSVENGVFLKPLEGKSWLSWNMLQAAWSADGTAVSWFKAGPSFHLGELQLGTPIPEQQAHKAIWRQGDISLERQKNGGLHIHKDGMMVGALKPMENGVSDATLIGKGLAAAVTRPFGRFSLFETATGTVVRRFQPTHAASLAPSPNGRFLLAVAPIEQILRVYHVDQEKPLLSLYMQGQDWIVWTPEGYYAATPGGERMMGWLVDNGIDKATDYYPAQRFRKQMYRPDVIKLLIAKGNLKDALESANAVLKKEGKNVVEGVADLNNLLPPQATLQILDKKDLPKVTVKARAAAAVKEQPVMGLRLLLDGRVLAGEGSVNYATGKDNAEAEWTVTIPPGKHSLAVLARGPDASAVSEAVEVTFVNVAQQPELHVLTIGVSNYQAQALNLEFAAKDAIDLFANFQTAGKGALFRAVQGKALVDGMARRNNVLMELAELRKKVKPNDLVVVYFAGHGVKEKDKFYLLTVEANTNNLAKTTVSGDDLRKSLGEFPCQVLLILDACHSAGALKAFRPAVDDLTRTLTDDECGVAVMCAAMSHEKALEKQGNGLFTKAMIQALNRAEGVPFNRHDKRLYIHHLHSYVFDEVRELSGDRQHPFLSLPWVVESFPVVQFAPKNK